MPWKTKSSNQMRIEFIKLVRQPGASMAEACRKYGISRMTGYKWLNRYAEMGVAGLAEQSKRPHNQPNRLPEAVVFRIVNIRVGHKHWGADKIRSILRREGGGGGLQANHEWTIDFKGWWKSGDGSRKCYPLTVRDARSRFILGVTLLGDDREETVRAAMIDIFKNMACRKASAATTELPLPAPKCCC